MHLLYVVMAVEFLRIKINYYYYVECVGIEILFVGENVSGLSYPSRLAEGLEGMGEDKEEGSHGTVHR